MISKFIGFFHHLQLSNLKAFALKKIKLNKSDKLIIDRPNLHSLRIDAFASSYMMNNQIEFKYALSNIKYLNTDSYEKSHFCKFRKKYRLRKVRILYLCRLNLQLLNYQFSSPKSTIIFTA